MMINTLKSIRHKTLELQQARQKIKDEKKKLEIIQTRDDLHQLEREQQVVISNAVQDEEGVFNMLLELTERI